MNKEWSEMNKTLQLQIKRKDTFATGIDTLLELRRNLMEQIMQFSTELTDDDFSAMPYMNVKGYHNKTIAYSLNCWKSCVKNINLYSSTKKGALLPRDSYPFVRVQHRQH